ncbi:hypothetical protein APUTEX25_004431 [Auxenochlorella protothecoides]|uniref:Uncharacterized protein n=1 Tax=Auxenochlorella protothecoides TaxID=3075 RepID=A0A1D1ZYG2_AUXPR|nr:hypothetical protein APUTEX25_004431 [Auxenochlorella protothecoides]|eukprot:RMZ56007.1 hypothetical protein APUTEX25_004431 [Auxenochlorella protothecoides]
MHHAILRVFCICAIAGLLLGLCILQVDPAPPQPHADGQTQLPPPPCTPLEGSGASDAVQWMHAQLGRHCQPSNLTITIPPILHHIYFPDRASFLRGAQGKGSATNPAWSESCLRLHPHWEHVFWGEAEAKAFVAKFWPGFLATFLSYDHPVSRSDALRPLLLHTLGGVYLDLDIECFAPLEPMLAGADVVLQGTGPMEGVTNGAMASVPGHQLWLDVAGELERRAPRADLPIDRQTGPGVLAAAARRALGLPDGAGGFAGLHAPSHAGGALRVWPLGSFLTPCAWDDRRCHRAVAIARGAGAAPPGVVGYHRYSASWHGRGRNRHGVLTPQDVVWAVGGAQLGM